MRLKHPDGKPIKGGSAVPAKDLCREQGADWMDCLILLRAHKIQAYVFEKQYQVSDITDFQACIEENKDFVRTARRKRDGWTY